MQRRNLPPPDDLYAAVMGRDTAYEGIFVVAVRTTGIFCRPTCPARKPRRENVEFYPTPRDALLQGYRPCKRCRPLDRDDQPGWLRPLLERVEAAPEARWRDQDLRDLGLEPVRVRRWFRANHGMTFHAYSRSRRLGIALGQMRHGDAMARTAHATGFDSLSGFCDALKRLTGDSAGKSRTRPVVTMTRISTDLGPMVAGTSDEGVCLLEFADRRMLETQVKRLQRWLRCVVTPGEHPYLDDLRTQLDEYFARDRREFDLPLHVPGTEFQRAVWDALRGIPHGEISTYETIAWAIGRPTAVRAVGRANGDNRVAIVIPCHRVVGSDGRLVGYGGSLWRKQRLLELEGAATPALSVTSQRRKSREGINSASARP